MRSIKLSSVVESLDELNWKKWVYLDVEQKIGAETPCLLLNPDEADLGADGFTPLAAEEASMKEFLSVQDLRSIVANFKAGHESPSMDDLLSAIVYFYEKDAFKA
ncbi:MAG: hypothetical protein JJ949_12590 [Roseicyclus sp.]|nr:hypothetical protein [Roseicyclus sp.]MBO6924272.1 hypothetical protein [Roseicyclus sp.]